MSDIDRLPYVEAELNYLGPIAARPRYYAFEPGPNDLRLSHEFEVRAHTRLPRVGSYLATDVVRQDVRMPVGIGMEGVDGVDIARDIFLDDEVIGESADLAVHAMQLVGGASQKSLARVPSVLQHRAGFKPADVVIRFQDAREGQAIPDLVRRRRLTGQDRLGHRKAEAGRKAGKSRLVHEVLDQVRVGEQEAVGAGEALAISRDEQERRVVAVDEDRPVGKRATERQEVVQHPLGIRDRRDDRSVTAVPGVKRHVARVRRGDDRRNPQTGEAPQEVQPAEDNGRDRIGAPAAGRGRGGGGPAGVLAAERGSRHDLRVLRRAPAPRLRERSPHAGSSRDCDPFRHGLREHAPYDRSGGPAHRLRV